jgi:SHS2 domain-containing protein
VYRWVEHTGELELLIEAPTEASVFAEALEAFVELVSDGGGPDGEREEIALESEDHEALLADWLGELIYLAETKRFVPDRLADLELDGGRLRASVRGHRGAPRQLVKAATLHKLRLEPAEGSGWLAQVVLDV